MIRRLTGLQKASILLLSLDEDTAAQVLRNLDDDQIKRITQCMTGLDAVSTEEMRQVLKEAREKIQEIGLVGKGGRYVQQLLRKALGEKRTEELFQVLRSISLSEEERSNVLLTKQLDSKMLATLIQDEHPQIIALILSCLDTDKAREVIVELPPELRAEVIYRISHMENIPPEVVEEIQETLKSKIASSTITETKRRGGLNKVLEIVKKLDKNTVEIMLADLQEIDPELATKVENQLFTFDDLATLDDRSVQTLLREIDTRDLVLALKAASDQLKDLFLRNMSHRAREMILDDMEATGPVRLRDVEAAQQRIVDVAKKLEEEGKIILQRGGEEDAFV
ncbi:MAG: flagellar motor switch protein FliG [Candidatus Desulfofervidaceae bacterium]|nr:flagellar motor switch protein FliG [Candidatus Desulfofervidaceae bacterium]